MQTEPAIQVAHDGEITISTADSRKATQWRKRDILWSQLVERLREPKRTPETFAEYEKMPKQKRDEIKDVGGFVGGALKNGRRKAGNVSWRTLITLDADNVKTDIWSSIELLFDVACVMYSTHSHSPEKPRYRLVFPLKRPVQAEEYQPVARWLADKLGMDQFDSTTFEAHRLMYWPSAAKDGEFVFKYHDGPWLDPDEILAKYADWRDPSQWPASEAEAKARRRQAERQGDPWEKPGLVGAFCRTYSIEEAIEKFLADVYAPAGEGRYSYIPGTTAAGLVVYEDGKFAYSFHGSDPAGGKLLNAFDLVRVHKFGHLDEEADPETPVNSLPSYKEMRRFAAEDERVKQTLGTENLKKAKADFENADWTGKLDRSAKTGALLNTFNNFELILENDPVLGGAFAYDDFNDRAVVLKELPWNKRKGRPLTNADYAATMGYIENVYGLWHEGRFDRAMTAVMQKKAFHPVRDYLNSLEWDGKPRLARVFIDYLGVDDNPHIEKLTEIVMVAAVARVFEPGIKFDCCPVLVGPQGVGKSSIIQRLSKGWFSDSTDTMSGKEAYESLQGAWLVELAELAAVRRAADIETVKKFLSKTADKYRPPYGRVVEEKPRQCVFFGTTNTPDFLTDTTGNRRFWPFEVVSTPPKTWADLTDEDIDQIWAEAVQLWNEGHRIYLDPKEDKETLIWLEGKQKEHTRESELVGIVQQFLDTPLPENWNEMSLADRRAYYSFDEKKEGAKRTEACIMEVWAEFLGRDPASIDRRFSVEVGAILDNMPGWERIGPRRTQLYGTQRFWRLQSQTL